MQRVDSLLQPIDSTPKDLETDFPGLVYSKAEGLLAVGKVKNIYTESYADGNGLRVHLPAEPKRDATTVKFTFYFTGADRYMQYLSLCEYMKGQKVKYWDTKRNRFIYFVARNEFKPAEEVFVGSNPYLKFEFEVTNVDGTNYALT